MGRWERCGPRQTSCLEIGSETVIGELANTFCNHGAAFRIDSRESAGGGFGRGAVLRGRPAVPSANASANGR